MQEPKTEKQAQSFLKGQNHPQIRDLLVAESGHGTVLILFLQDESVVLKPCQETPISLFFNSLAKMLGVCTPQMRVLTKKTQELLIFEKKIKEKMVEKGINAFGKIGNSFAYVFYQVMEYIPSLNFSQAPCHCFLSLTRNHFLQLGTILAFDLIINNNDRFQLVWEGQGNLDNVLIQIDSSSQKIDRFVFIDHIGNLCNMDFLISAQNANKYIKKINLFYQQIMIIQQSLLQQSSQIEVVVNNTYFAKFMKQFESQTQYTLTKADLSHIIHALLSTTQLFLEELHNGRIQELLQIVLKASEIEKAYQCLWKQELRSINLNFCYAFSKSISPLLNKQSE